MLAVSSESLGALLAAVSGVSFALIGIAYKIGQPRGATPAQIMLIMCAIGAGVFGTRCVDADFSQMPASVWIVGLVVGVTQWVMLQLLAAALRKGPLSGAWCAVSLSFLPVFPYALAVFKQSPTTMQLVSAGLASLCVVSASLNQRSAQSGVSAKPGWRLMSYGLLLVVLLLVNGVLGVGQYDLSQRAWGHSTLLKTYQDVFYTVLYVTISVLLFAQLIVRRQFHPKNGWMWGLGALAGAGSISGLYTQGVAFGLTGPVVLAISGSAGLITAGVVGTAAFNEKRTLLWYTTILLGVLAVAMGTPK